MNSLFRPLGPQVNLRNHDVFLRPLYELENHALAGIEMSFAGRTAGSSVKPEALAEVLGSIRGSLSPEAFVCVSLG